MTAPRPAHEVLQEIRAVCALQYPHHPDLLTTDRRGHLEAAWATTESTDPRHLPRRADHRLFREREQRLLGLVHQYATHPGRDTHRVEAPDPRFPHAQIIHLSPPVKVCPQCGANDGDGTGRLDGLLERWHDPTGSGWQCHNTTCFWFAADGEAT